MRDFRIGELECDARQAAGGELVVTEARNASAQLGSISKDDSLRIATKLAIGVNKTIRLGNLQPVLVTSSRRNLFGDVFEVAGKLSRQFRMPFGRWHF